ncbi:MAG: right-handed parallel beta-helix repeat-containing protein [Pirellulales bacterium]
MRYSPYLLLAAIVLLSGMHWIGAAQTSPTALKSTLPGARAIIDAADYPSLQAALDALPEGGGVVHIPPGEFQINQPLTLSRGDVMIQGSGTATHIKNTNQQGQPALVLSPPEGDDSLWRVTLSKLRITGNEMSGHGIVARSVDEILIEGVSVSHHGGHGVLLDGCYEDPRIVQSLLTYNGQTGLELAGCHDIVVSANQFEENRDALRCADGFNLCMTGNNLDDHLRHGVIIENTYGSVVSGNMIEECQGTAILLDRDCYGITLSANVIAHNFGGGVDLRDAHGCAVSANTFTIVPQRAVVVGPESGRITITGNNFSDSQIGDSERRAEDDQSASGIVLDGTSDVAISGNLFAGLDGPGIGETEAGSRRVLVTGNVLTQLEEAGNLPEAWRTRANLLPGEQTR